MATTRTAALVLLLCCGSAARAEQGSADRVLQSLSRCRALATPDARLDCFDKATGALEDAVRTHAVRIVDQQDLRQARRSLFGFTIPRVALFGGGEGPSEKFADKDAFQELNTTIARVRSLENGRVELHLAEGDAVWVTTESMTFPPKAGAKVRIRAGALGNYFITIAGERSVRGMRLR